MSYDQALLFSPDWALTGYRDQEAYVVVASQEMTHAEMRVSVETADIMSWASPDPIRRIVTRRTITLSIGMRRYSVAYGTSYADALSKLMRTWSPDESDTPGPGEVRGPQPEMSILDEASSFQLPPGGHS